MERDRRILWGWIILLALLIIGELVASRMAAQWREMYRHPDPMFEKMGGKQ